MRTQAALFAIAAMCVGRLPAQDSVVAAHDSTIAAHDTSCTYELCRLELQKGTKAWELFASAHRTPVPLDTLLTSVSPSVKANYVSYKRDAKAGTWLVILGSATEMVQYNMWENVVATGDKRKEQQEFPLILVPLSLWGAGWAEVSIANHHIRHAVELYNGELPEAK